MEKILITGITGFVGSHLADFCLRNEDTVVFGFRRYHLSNLRNVGHIEGKIEWIDCDMLRLEECCEGGSDIEKQGYSQCC